MGLGDSKAKYLSRNVILFTISGIGTKLITFLLVPLYTNFLSTTEYGTIDLIGTITNLVVPFLSLSLESVIDVFCLDVKNDAKDVIASGERIWARAIVINTIIGVLLYFFVPVENKQLFVFGYFAVFLSQGTVGVLASVYRGIERVEVNVISSLIFTLTLCVCNIVFLTIFKLGMLGYYISMIISAVISITFGISKIRFWEWHKKQFNKGVQRKMEKYGAPLVFNQIGWWLNNSVDKYVVIYFLGMADNGIYSIAYKIPTIISVFSGIFSSAWSLSAIKDYKADGSSEFASQMYSVYNTFTCVLCGLLLILNIPLASLLFAKEFFVAWKISGILVVATIFNGLAGFVGAFFAAAKDSRSYAVSTIIGGVVNIGISIALINSLGYLGVAIGTLVSYIVVWAIRVHRSRQYVKLDISWLKNIIMYALVFIECVIGLRGFETITILIQCCILLFLVIMGRTEISEIIGYFVKTYIRRKNKDKKTDN